MHIINSFPLYLTNQIEKQDLQLFDIQQTKEHLKKQKQFLLEVVKIEQKLKFILKTLSYYIDF